MYIVKVPSVYTHKLPGGQWLNLARDRKLQVGFNALVVEISNRQRQSPSLLRQ